MTAVHGDLALQLADTYALGDSEKYGWTDVHCQRSLSTSAPLPDVAADYKCWTDLLCRQQSVPVYQ